MRRVIGALALLGWGFGSISLVSCGKVAPAPHVSSGGSASGGGAGGSGNGSAGAGVGVGTGASAGGPGLSLGGAGECTGPKWFCHPNTTSRSREDTTPTCSWISSCVGVECAYGDTSEVLFSLPELACRKGYEVALPPGACCYDCSPTQEPFDTVTCAEACPEAPPTCQAGYHAAARPDGCCLECVVDQDYCNSDVDCVLAKRPANCCACVEAVSVRRLDADDCYTGISPARTTPDDCPPDNNCELVDCFCPAEI